MTESACNEDILMVDAITAVSASSATSPTKVESSLSITSEPDNKYVAARQSQIEAGLVALSDARIDEDKDQKSEAEVEEEFPMLFEGHERRKKRVITALGLESTGVKESRTLSGESKRIGTTNFDDDTPFGRRVAII